MPDRITEADLVLPALLCIERGSPELSTTQLQECLRTLLQPHGEDLEILAGRNDDKFSQKVRNLRSHETLEGGGWATYERRGNNGYWRLTEAGVAMLDDHREFVESVLAGRFDYETQQAAFHEAATHRSGQAVPRRRVLVFDEDESVTEGQISQVAAQRRARSKRLREAALALYCDNEGQCVCEACGFDFHETYGDRGSGYIEIHHKKPIFTYDETDLDLAISEALANLVPLCANCHRMIHRRRDDIWTIDRLKDALSDRL